MSEAQHIQMKGTSGPSMNSTENDKIYIMKTLTESPEPWKAVVEIQQILSSHLINVTNTDSKTQLDENQLKRWQPSISLLDELGCLRSTLYFLLLEKLKNKLIKMIDQIIINTTANHSVITASSPSISTAAINPYQINQSSLNV